MTIFEALRKSHDIQRELSDRVLDSQGDSDERRQVFNRLQAELATHAKFEERCLYLPIMQVEMTQQKARHSIAEHHEIDEYLEELSDTDMSSPHLLAVFKKLHHRIHHHLDEEENEVFQLAGKALSKARKDELAKEYTALQRMEKSSQ